MMKKVIVGFLCVAVVGAAAVVLWPKTLVGEQADARGSVYYFSDGVIAVDRSGDPHSYHVWVTEDFSKLERAEIDEEGGIVLFGGPGINEEGAAEFGMEAVSIAYSRPYDGKVHVILESAEVSEGMGIEMDTKVIDDLVASEKWETSLRALVDAWR